MSTWPRECETWLCYGETFSSLEPVPSQFPDLTSAAWNARGEQVPCGDGSKLGRKLLKAKVFFANCPKGASRPLASSRGSCKWAISFRPFGGVAKEGAIESSSKVHQSPSCRKDLDADCLLSSLSEVSCTYVLNPNLLANPSHLKSTYVSIGCGPLPVTVVNKGL